MIARDAQDPRSEWRVAVVTVERSIRAHKNLLRCVFSLCGAAEQPPAQSEHATIVVPVKRFEIDFQNISCTAPTGTR
jgi:hypothetical protein